VPKEIPKLGNPLFSADLSKVVFFYGVPMGWDLNKGEAAFKFLHPTPNVMAEDFVISPDLARIAFPKYTRDSTRSAPIAESIAVWDLMSDTQVATLVFDSPVVTAGLTFSPDAKMLAVDVSKADDTTTPHRVQLWDVDSERQIAAFENPFKQGYGYSSFVYDVGDNHQVMLYDVTTSQAKSLGIQACAFAGNPAISTDGKIVAVSTCPPKLWVGTNLVFWDVEANKELDTVYLKGFRPQILTFVGEKSILGFRGCDYAAGIQPR